MNDAASPKKGWFARLRRPSPTMSVLTLLLVGFVAARFEAVDVATRQSLEALNQRLLPLRRELER